MRNAVQLVTYIDRLGDGNIDALRRLLSGPLHGLFGAVHLLPFFYPIDGSDAGFDPIEHTCVDPRLGGWSDIKSLSCELDVMADVIVNHISDRSPQFMDFWQHGKVSRYVTLFLTRDTVFPEGASEADLDKIYRPRPGRPFRDVRLANGEHRALWTTFTPQQIDINVTSEMGRAYLQRVLTTLAVNGIRTVRLDAAGYAIKKAGTSCFMLPETLDFIAQFAARAHELHVEVLVEVHAHYLRQMEIARHVDRVYDFALPALLLHAFEFATASVLKRWIAIRPQNAITVLDTHDGIGIIDIAADPGNPSESALVPAGQIDRLVESIHRNSGGESRRATGSAASNLDLYQVNCTFFDALARDELRYLLARAIQFFIPGIPQVYYVGLLAGHNDLALLARTQVGRDINRHYYSRAEIDIALNRAVVMNLLALIRFRNTHPAFQGTFTLLQSAPEVLSMRWELNDQFASLLVNAASCEYQLLYSAKAGPEQFGFNLTAAPAGTP